MSVLQEVLVYRGGQASSLIAIVLFATISLLGIFAVALRYSWDSIIGFCKGRRAQREHHSKAFFHTQLGAYIASLSLSNALSSVAFIINATWAAEKVATTGITCEAQGILAQIGDTGTAYFTGAIAIHSFNTLVLRNKLPVWICLAVNVFGWLLAVLFAATPTWVNPTFGPVYGIDGLSCGISLNYPLLSTLLELLPLLVGSLVSVVVYTLVFLVLRGTLTIQGGIRFNFNRSHRWSMSSVTTVEYQRFIAAVARSMLWYPFAYNILLIPLIIVSLMQASGFRVAFEALVFAKTTASLLGLANALILVNTLRILRPFLDGTMSVGSVGTNSRKSRDADMESFFAGAKSPSGIKSPVEPEKAALSYRERDSKQEWTPPPRSASKQATNVSAVTRGINRVSRGLSLKRKEPQSNPVVEVARPITPVAELNAMLSAPEPVFKKPSLPSSPRLRGASPTVGLPAPRRDTRSPLIRQPTLPSEPSPSETPFVSISLSTPEPPKKSAVLLAPTETGKESRHTSASDSLVSMYMSRTPETEEMDKPAPPPKPLPVPPKSRPAPMPLSARPPLSLNTLTPSPLAALRSARPAGSAVTPSEALASREWADRVRRNNTTTPSTATLKAERRRSRSLDLSPPSALPTARTPMYGATLTAGGPTPTPQRGPSLSAVSSARTVRFESTPTAIVPMSARPQLAPPASARPQVAAPLSARPLPSTPARTPGGSGSYGYL